MPAVPLVMPPACEACPVMASSIWGPLSARDHRELMAQRSQARFRSGQTLFFEGHPCHGLHCVAGGLLALRKADDSGNSVILRLVHPGETLGYPAFFGRMTYTASAEVLREARVCFFPVRAVQELLERSATLRGGFLHLLAEELRSYGEARLRHATQPLARRLGELLLELLPTCGERLGGGARLSLPLSRRDLAAMLGVRPETVARAVKLFCEQGLASFEGREVRIPDLARLRREGR
jgi:CRP-like cAMP-binding protein